MMRKSKSQQRKKVLLRNTKLLLKAPRRVHKNNRFGRGKVETMRRRRLSDDDDLQTKKGKYEY